MNWLNDENAGALSDVIWVWCGSVILDVMDAMIQGLGELIVRLG